MTGKRSVTGFCTRCSQKITFIEGHEPDECPNQDCRSPNWRTAVLPAKGYAISENDRRFLKSIRVDGDT